ncbi:SDR family NAD(P)-dependent oxidoreductase, partial [Scytonema sp. NUACC26]|uniref:SDR family NAD(P)-dependent oxidoreductase n=1 Tax=Scytonema sp. NUACC26 TaxID=3140176 RepID=UPI0038B3535B
MSTTNHSSSSNSFSNDPKYAVFKLLLEKKGIRFNAQTIPRRDELTSVPLSFAQERLWFLNQLSGASATYNMPAALRLTGELNLNALHQALAEIVRRHEVLRTNFTNINGMPMQVIHLEASMDMEVVNLQNLEESERKLVVEQQIQQSALTPFDLESAPLIRCSLWQLSNTDYVFCINMHHIVCDGWSIGVLIRELSALYKAFCTGAPSPLPELEIQYADFTLWQRQRLSGTVLEKQLQYWVSQLQGAPELLQIPTDRPRSGTQSDRGATQSFTLTTELTQKLEILSQQTGSTLFMTLLAAFATLMYRYSGQSDVVIGSPIANRNPSEIQSLIGFFVNTLALRTRLEDNPSFEQLLAQVQETTLKAYEHQDVPFEQVVEALRPQRSISYAPLFQVMFVLQNAPMGEIELPGVKLSQLNAENTTAKFDLTLSISESPLGMDCAWEYKTNLFDGSTIERMAAHYQNLLLAIAKNPQQKISEIPLLTDSELEQLVQTPNNITTSNFLRQYFQYHDSNNLQLYILDNRQQLVPLGVEGEIYLGNYDLSPDNFNPKSKKSINIIAHPQLGKLLKTGEWGCRRGNDSLELLGKEHRKFIVKGQRINLQRIEESLLTATGVEDCYVTIRNQDLVAYVVKDSFCNQKFLHNHLKSQLPGYPLPCTYVPVTALPLTNKGEVDEVGLASLGVIDSDLIPTWEEQISSHPEIKQVALVVQPNIKTIYPIHLEDVLPSNKVVSERLYTIEALRVIDEENNSFALEKKLPAISHGKALLFPESVPQTLGKMLQKTAGKLPGQRIIYINSDGSEQVQSYSQLLEDAQRILGGLRKQGLKPQDKVIFQLEQNRDFISAFWGCVLGGFIPVPIGMPVSYDQPNATLNKLQNSWQMLEKPLILTDNKSLPDIHKWSLSLNLDGFELETIENLQEFSVDNNYYNSQPEDLAILLLTSGSTGTPKAVKQSHKSLLSHCVGTTAMNNFSTADISLNWFPLDHVGGIVMFHLRDVYLGCQQIHAPTQMVLQTPTLWLDWISKYKVTITWSPNFAYRLIVEHLEKFSKKTVSLSDNKWNLSSLKFILNAGEAIVAKTVRRFLEILTVYQLSSRVMHPAWGMSETSSALTFADNFLLELTTDEQKFTELGSPIPGCSIRIVNDRNQIVEEGKTGFLQVQGASVTSGYYCNQEATQEAFTEDGWFDTGDLGFIREGHLTITGRKKDVIIINGINYYTHEIEAAVEELSSVEVSYTAAFGISSTGNNTEELAIIFSPYVSSQNQLAELLKKIRGKIVSDFGITPSYLIPVEKEIVPKTSIGKIQRSQLKQRFIDGEFKSILHQVDLLLYNANTIPNWFYRQTWQRKERRNILLSSFNQNTLALIFADKLGLGTFLAQELSGLNHPYVIVTIGSDFQRISPNHYSLVPGNLQHYHLLIDSLAQNNQVIGHILHLWYYNEQIEEVSTVENLESTQQQGLYSVIFLVQALEQIQGTRQVVKLLCVANNSQSLHPTDKIQPEKATLLGLLKTISQEMPWLSTRHLDLPLAEVELNSSYTLQEMYSSDRELTVAIKNGQRLVSRLKLVDMTCEEKQAIPIKVGGTYLITGGLGGVGIEIAKYLLEHYQTRLILVGQTHLPDNDSGKIDGEKGDKIITKLQRYQQLQQLPGSVVYESVDICNLDRLQQIVEKATSEWKTQLDGVLHLAGIFQETPIESETPENVAAVLRPKVIGTWVLHQLLYKQENALFIHFSSVNGFFGGMNVASYSAANSFQSAFSDYQRHNGFQSYCCSWSMWHDTGMSQDYEFAELSRAKGYFAIAPQQGIYSFLAALSHPSHDLLIGLDGTKASVQRFIGNCDLEQKLTAYFTTQTPKFSLSKLQEVQLCDRYGMLNQIDFVQLEQTSLSDTGEINREQLTGIYRDLSASEQTKPRNEIERQLVEIFEEILNVSCVGIHENFFELGGHSLLATQLISRLKQTFA